ncbi:hypothetical protein GO755_38480 [Spirosoma sp. HMF4905]|uniref:Uncharacterized protein n=1 Tax=Spirosoma arboris TaxID=2682092 RepID=A0A7K1SQ79_9BACT|nr:hypothetical protein [Spirosoma arboris]MVM35964.1 hypothetical protein [Spirosoma arboris]
MKATALLLLLTLLACNSQSRKQPIGIRVKRGADGKIVAVPDSSRRDSF